MKKNLQTKHIILFWFEVIDIKIPDIFYKIEKFLKTSWAPIITINGINFLMAGPFEKNPAYGRHQLSRLMLLVEPIQNKTRYFNFYKFFYFLFLFHTHTRTAPHRTASHSTAPHRTALHCTAPHRTAPHHIAPPPTPPPPPPPYGREGGLTNERPGSGHVIIGPMRALEKNYMKRGHQTHRQTDRHVDYKANSAQRDELVKTYQYGFGFCFIQLLIDL